MAGEGGVDSPGKGLTTHILGRDLGNGKYLDGKQYISVDWYS